MKIKVNMWVVFSVLIASLCVGLAIHTHDTQKQAQQQLAKEKQRVATAQEQYKNARRQPVNELPKYTKVHDGFNQFMQSSLNKINQHTDGAPYLKYGTPDAYEALSLLFSNGEGGSPKVELKKQNLTFNEIDGAMEGFGPVVFKVSYGKQTIEKKGFVYVTLSKSGYVNELKFGDFMPDEGGQNNAKNE